MLNNAEIGQTSNELRTNLASSGLTEDQVATDLGFTAAGLQSVLAVDRADPADVWFLRDYLQQAMEKSGAQLTPYTVLTTRSRRQAAGWFPLRNPPLPAAPWSA